MTVDGEVEGKKVIDTKFSFLVKGMRSRRNSPFNALIQILLGIQIIRKIMMRPRTKGALSSPLRKIVMETNSCEEEGEEKKEEDLLSTDDLFSNVCSKWGGQHMDMNSEQLLVRILDALHTEEIKAYKLAEDSCTIIGEIFSGELLNRSRFRVLSLKVPSQPSGHVLIKDCMDIVVTECSGEKPIRKAPYILVIHLKNCTYSYRNAEEELDIQPFIHSTRENDTNTIYSLVGVLCHEGENYIAYVRGGSIRLKTTIKHCDWVYARDKEVTEASSKTIRDRPELLFYERVGDPLHFEDMIRINKKDGIKEKKEEIQYKTKLIHFVSGCTRIVLEDNNAPFPLLPVYNVLLLSGKLTLHSDEVSKHHILKQIKQLLKGKTSLMVDVKADLNMMFSRTYLFEPTPEVNLLDYLEVPIHHGWVFKPDSNLASVLHEHSYKGLISMDDSSHNEMILKFLKGPQVTEYGLTCLHADMEENTPALLFCNNHFSTIVKVNGTVYMLATEACKAGAVWEKLEVNGGGQPMDANFAPINLEVEGVDGGGQPIETNFAPINFEVEGKESSSSDNNIVIFECAGGSHMVVGLPNPGNRCFLNVVLQMLLALDTLRTTILDPNVQKEGTLLNLLTGLFYATIASNAPSHALRDTLIYQNSIFSSISYSSKFSKVNKHHCSLELFNHIYNQAMEESGWSDTILTFIFEGIFSDTVSYTKCPHPSTRKEAFHCLILSIPSKRTEGIDDEVDNSNGLVSVESCLASYFEEAQVESTCDVCLASKVDSTGGTKRYLIEKGPTVLVIALQRGLWTGVKREANWSGVKHRVNGHVRFEEVLDIHKFMDPCSKDLNRTKYRLIGVVQHHEITSELGHYTAYVRCGQDWVFTNDNSISVCTLDDALQCEAYLLFYERDGDLDPPPASLLISQGSEWKVVGGDKKDNKEKKAKNNLNLLSPQEYKHTYKKPYLKGSATSESEKHEKDIQGIPWIHPIPAATTVEEGKKSFLEVTTTDKDGKVEQGFKMFLNTFVCHGESQPYYHCRLKGIHSSGASSYVLHVPYSHIREFSPHLAMTVCNDYSRLKNSLKRAARSFAKQYLQMDLEPKLTLKILQYPVKHQWLREYLKKIRSVEVMEVYGHKRSTIYNPTPDYTLVLQGIIWFILMKHKSGLSWNGGFTIDDIEVVNGNIFIINKPPQKFTVSEELIEAMEKDFLTYVELFLNQLIIVVLSSAHLKAHQVNGEYHVPYLREFCDLFKRMRSYSRFWSNDDLAERFRDFIRHHPFLKPPLVIANFLSGIYNACRSHDDEDPDAFFKSIVEREAGEWTPRLDSGNSMTESVFKFKENKMLAELEEKKRQGIILEKEEPWPQNLGAMVEFIRHLFSHGSDYSKDVGNLRLVQGQDCKTVPYGDKNPRKQLMRTLEETEVAAAVAVAEFVCKLMLKLLETNCISANWILPMWKNYKNSFSSSSPIDERAMEQWDKWWLQPDEDDEE